MRLKDIHYLLLLANIPVCLSNPRMFAWLGVVYNSLTIVLGFCPSTYFSFSFSASSPSSYNMLSSFSVPPVRALCALRYCQNDSPLSTGKHKPAPSTETSTSSEEATPSPVEASAPSPFLGRGLTLRVFGLRFSPM